MKEIINESTKGINTDLFSSQEQVKFIKSLLLIRLVEEKVAFEKKNNTIKGPVHLAAGQEAVPVGIAQELLKTDTIFGTHRSHHHILSLGCDLVKFFSELLGKENGLSNGFGGSMHLIDEGNGFSGSVPIVAGTVPIAVGAAMAHKLKNNSNISVAFFGDGAIEEGIVFESLNLAKINDLPVLFVVENNFYASHMHITERQPDTNTFRLAKACSMEYVSCDGNNVCEINKAANKYINKCRANKGPAFIECFTYRLYGHVDWRDDIDVGVTRSKSELEDWKLNDPIARLLKTMIMKNIFSYDKYLEMKSEINEIIDKAWSKALKGEYPNESDLLTYVYKN